MSKQETYKNNMTCEVNGKLINKVDLFIMILVCFLVFLALYFEIGKEDIIEVIQTQNGYVIVDYHYGRDCTIRINEKTICENWPK